MAVSHPIVGCYMDMKPTDLPWLRAVGVSFVKSCSAPGCDCKAGYAFQDNPTGSVRCGRHKVRGMVVVEDARFSAECVPIPHPGWEGRFGLQVVHEGRLFDPFGPCLPLPPPNSGCDTHPLGCLKAPMYVRGNESSERQRAKATASKVEQLEDRVNRLESLLETALARVATLECATKRAREVSPVENLTSADPDDYIRGLLGSKRKTTPPTGGGDEDLLADISVAVLSF
eukprot:jgi/Mesvir1/20233/Mv13471-RA.1